MSYPQVGTPLNTLGEMVAFSNQGPVDPQVASGLTAMGASWRDPDPVKPKSSFNRTFIDAAVGQNAQASMIPPPPAVSPTTFQAPAPGMDKRFI